MNTTTPTRRFTHVMIYGPDNKILALTKAEARSTMRFWRKGERPDVSGIWTYNVVVRAYMAADRAATREEAHARLEKWGPLLQALEDAEQRKAKATITPADVRQGDHLLRSDGTVGWIAQEDAAFTPSGVTAVLVQHVPDGGIDARYWDADTSVRFLTGTTADGCRTLRLLTYTTQEG